MAKKSAPKGKKRAAKKSAPKGKPDLMVFDPGAIPEDPSVHFDDTGVALSTFKAPTIVGRPPKFPDLESLKRQIDMYFAFCDPHLENVNTPVLMKDGQYKIVEVPRETRQRPYTVSGLAYFLFTTRDVLLDYEHLADKDEDGIPQHLRHHDKEILKEYSNTIKRAKQKIHSYVEEKLLSGGHPAGPIFNLKNNFTRWEDKTIQENPQETENRKAIEELRSDLSGRVKKVKKPRI